MRYLLIIQQLLLLILSFDALGMDEQSSSPADSPPPVSILGYASQRSLETKIVRLESAYQLLGKEHEELRNSLEQLQGQLTSNNQIIDALNNYQSSVNELIPFIRTLIMKNAQFFGPVEITRFTRICDNIIDAEADCKKKTYGE